jgi:hypothetical protein
VPPPPAPSTARNKWRKAHLMVAVSNSFRDAGAGASVRRTEQAAAAAAAKAAATAAASRMRRGASTERLQREQREERLDQSKAKLRRVVAKVREPPVAG